MKFDPLLSSVLPPFEEELYGQFLNLLSLKFGENKVCELGLLQNIFIFETRAATDDYRKMLAIYS